MMDNNFMGQILDYRVPLHAFRLDERIPGDRAKRVGRVEGRLQAREGRCNAEPPDQPI